MIDVANLVKDYGTVVAVNGVSFHVGRGEVVGFLGPNGAGKSTTLRILSGFLGPTSGRVRIDGRDVLEEGILARRSIGYMPEAAPLYPEMRVREYLRFRAELKGVVRKKRVSAVGEAMEAARVVEMEDTLIGHLSKGYRQRVGLADALVAKPPLLILDEPTAGLDPNQIREVRDLIRSLGESHTILLSTHILPEVESTCARAIVIDRGKVVAEGTIDELRAGRKGAGATLLVTDPMGQAAKIVEGVRGVGSVTELEESPGLRQLSVRYTSGAPTDGSTLEQVVAALVTAGLGVREATPARATLEDVFAELTLADVDDPGKVPEGGGATMSGFIAVFKREMLSLWVTPLAWVLLFIFLLLQGASFYQILLHFAAFSNMAIDSGPVQAYFGQSLFLLLSLLLVCPALTMRLFAEERRSGTIEGLLTAPVSAAQVVLGKYAATFTTFVLMWIPTVLYVVILRTTGDVDWQVVASSYLGVLGVGAGYLAVGTLMSAMSKSQLVAMMLTSLIIFGLLILGIGERIFEPGPIRDVCAHISVLSQVDELSKGVVDLRRLVFDATLVMLPLFVTVRVVDSWRWG